MIDVLWFKGPPRRAFSDDFYATNGSELDGWLLAVVRESGILTLARENPAEWSKRKTSMTPDDEAWIEEWRRKAERSASGGASASLPAPS